MGKSMLVQLMLKICFLIDGKTMHKVVMGQMFNYKQLPLEHIENNFYYSILDIFKAKTDDKVILSRESWWKNTLLTRRFGYNSN
jgi:hypothetical protein